MVNSRKKRSASPRFVGRKHELQALWTALDSTLANDPALVILEGEAGIGKTTLADHFANQAVTRKPTLLVAHSEGAPPPSLSAAPSTHSTASADTTSSTSFYSFSQIFEQITTQLAYLPVPDSLETGNNKEESEALQHWATILRRFGSTVIKAFARSLYFSPEFIRSTFGDAYVAQYDIATIRKLVTESFKPEELRPFCLDRPPLKFIVDHFGEKFSLIDMVNVVIEHCRKQELFPTLLEEIAKYNPRKYDRHSPDLLQFTWTSRERNLPDDPFGPTGSMFMTQYCRVMIELSRRWPLILVVDTLEQLDEGSWQLLTRLARKIHEQQARILVIGCYQAEKLESSEARWEEINQFTARIPVGQDKPFDFAQKLIRAYYPRHPFNPEFIRRLTEHTGANPRFLEAILGYLDEKDYLALEKQNQLAEKLTFEALHLPAELREVIAARLGELSERKRRMLSHASVQGFEFVREVLAHTLSKDLNSEWKGNKADAISMAIGCELEQVPHLVAQPANPKGQRVTRHVFRDKIIRDFAYQFGDEETRRIIHGWVGRKLEKLFCNQLDSIAPDLAYHFQLSGNLQRTLYYANRVAQILYSRYDMAAVHHWCDIALAAAKQLTESGKKPRKEQVWQAHGLKGDAFYFEGKWEQAEQEYTEVLQNLPPKLADTATVDQAVEIQRKIGETWRSRGSQRKALKEFKRARRLAEGRPQATPAQRAMLNREIGYVLAQQEKAKKALKHYRKAWDLVKDDPSEWALQASLCTCLGGAYEQRVGLDKGEEPTTQQRELLVMADSWHTMAVGLYGPIPAIDPQFPRDPLGQARALSNRAIVYEKLRDWDRCGDDHHKAIQLFKEVGHELGLAIARLDYGEMLRQRGYNAQAAQEYLGSLEVFVKTGDRYGEMIDHYNLSLVEKSETLRQAHFFRALTLAALDELWGKLESYVQACLKTYPKGPEREKVGRQLKSFLADPQPSFPFLEVMAPELISHATADHAALQARAQDSGWLKEVNKALARAKC